MSLESYITPFQFHKISSYPLQYEYQWDNVVAMVPVQNGVCPWLRCSGKWQRLLHLSSALQQNYTNIPLYYVQQHKSKCIFIVSNIQIRLEVVVSATCLKTKCTRQVAAEGIELEKLDSFGKVRRNCLTCILEKACQAQGESVLSTNRGNHYSSSKTWM